MPAGKNRPPPRRSSASYDEAARLREVPAEFAVDHRLDGYLHQIASQSRSSQLSKGGRLSRPRSLRPELRGHVRHDVVRSLPLHHRMVNVDHPGKYATVNSYQPRDRISQFAVRFSSIER